MKIYCIKENLLTFSSLRKTLFLMAALLTSLHAQGQRDVQRQVWLRLKTGAWVTMKVFAGDTLLYEPSDSTLFVGRSAAYPVRNLLSLTTDGDDSARRIGWYGMEDNGTSVFVAQREDKDRNMDCYYWFEATDGICTKMEYRMESANTALLELYWKVINNSEPNPTGPNSPYTYTRRTLSRQRRLRMSYYSDLGTPDYALWQTEQAIHIDYTPVVEHLPMDDVRMLMMWWNSDASELPASLATDTLPFGTYDHATDTYQARYNRTGFDCTITLNWNDDHTRVTGSTMTWTFRFKLEQEQTYKEVSTSQSENFDIRCDGLSIIFTERYADSDGSPTSVSFDEAWHDLLLFDYDWMAPRLFWQQ